VDRKTKEIVSRLFGNCTKDLLRLYNTSALFLNAIDLTRNRYDSVRVDSFLSTVGNLDSSFMSFVDSFSNSCFTFTRSQLLDFYSVNAVHEVAKNFVIKSVAIMDTYLEELFVNLLNLHEKGITEKQVAGRVHYAFGIEGSLRKFLLDLGMDKPQDYSSSPEMVFDRYEEIRLIRHCLSHKNGVVDEEIRRKLDVFKDRLPEDLKEFSIASSYIVKDSKVYLDHSTLYIFRKWYLDAIVYFVLAFKIDLGEFTTKDLLPWSTSFIGTSE